MDINRLKWASRRGMRELDLVLLPFVEQQYSNLAEVDKSRFQLLLESEDNDLFDWFMGKSVPADPELLSIVETIRSYSQRHVNS